MADPKENEDINEELSTDELKSVSGGGACVPDSSYNVGMDTDGDGTRRSPLGSGYGGTKADWDRKIKRGGDSAICKPSC